MWRPLGILAVLLVAAGAARPAELVEEFDKAALDTTAWDACQIDRPPVEFGEVSQAGAPGRKVLVNRIDETTGNKERCLRPAAGVTAAVDAEEDREWRDLGPSLIPRSSMESLNLKECPRGDVAIQRNELRVQKRRADVNHGTGDPQWYAITFHADGTIPSCGSARWVLAQWKQEKGEPGDDDPSPFLAQRFDNGVLHVTVQNGHCRCAVAQASGDFDAAISALRAKEIAPGVLKETQPIKCIRSDLPRDAPETICTPTDLKVLTIGGAAPPPLPDPTRGWVRMTYRVRGGMDRRGEVDVYAGAEFVVRVTGLLGYETADPGRVKFKFGHYRDRIAGAAALSVDRFCLSRDVGTCAPDLRLAPTN